MTSDVEDLLTKYAMAAPSARTDAALTEAARRAFLASRRAERVYRGGWLAVAAILALAVCGALYTTATPGSPWQRQTAVVPHRVPLRFLARQRVEDDGITLREFSEDEMKMIRTILPVGGPAGGVTEGGADGRS